MTDAEKLANAIADYEACEEEITGLRNALQWAMNALPPGQAAELQALIGSVAVPCFADRIAEERDDIRDILLAIMPLVEPAIEHAQPIGARGALKLEALFSRVRHFEPMRPLRPPEGRP